MKTSFQRKINYSKVFHCRRAEDFHRWWSLLLYFCCSCRPAFSHFICVAGHSYFLPCRVWCYFLCVHFFFLFFALFVGHFSCRQLWTGRAALSPFPPTSWCPCFVCRPLSSAKTLGWDSFSDFLTSIYPSRSWRLSRTLSLLLANCQFDRNRLQFGGTVLLSFLVWRPVFFFLFFFSILRCKSELKALIVLSYYLIPTFALNKTLNLHSSFVSTVKPLQQLK